MQLDINLIKALVFDFSRVLLFAKDSSYLGDLNPLHRKLLEQYANYPFLDYFYLNQQLLDYLSGFSSKRLIIFTSGIIQDAPEIQKPIQSIFETVYSAEKMGVRKTEAEAYRRLCHELQLQPREILFIDDSRSNLDAASQAGLQRLLFTDNVKLFSVLNKMR
jgi:FMN phosphatase YigB (HAD superfamily)